uniref:Uncharacterized protein n=1 Tax=Magallana gigas TaxID=29159 RepID=K1PVS4_MAGGI
MEDADASSSSSLKVQPKRKHASVDSTKGKKRKAVFTSSDTDQMYNSECSTSSSGKIQGATCFVIGNFAGISSGREVEVALYSESGAMEKSVMMIKGVRNSSVPDLRLTLPVPSISSFGQTSSVVVIGVVEVRTCLCLEPPSPVLPV